MSLPRLWFLIVTRKKNADNLWDAVPLKANGSAAGRSVPGDVGAPTPILRHAKELGIVAACSPAVKRSNAKRPCLADKFVFIDQVQIAQ